MTDLVNDTSSRRQASLFFQNKEGIVSLTGYLALHFLGVWCAKVYAYLNSRPRHGLMQGWNTLHVFGVSVLWAAFYYVDAYVERVSRRSCNAAFILWMLAINCQAVLFNTLCLNVISAIAGGRLETAARSNDRHSRRNSAGSSSSLSGRRRVMSAYLPPLYNAVNRGMLYVFLWANLSTGAVNALLVKDTLRLEDSEARQILALHMALVVGGSLLAACCLPLTAGRDIISDSHSRALSRQVLPNSSSERTDTSFSSFCHVTMNDDVILAFPGGQEGNVSCLYVVLLCEEDCNYLRLGMQRSSLCNALTHTHTPVRSTPHPSV